MNNVDPDSRTPKNETKLFESLENAQVNKVPKVLGIYGT